MIFSTMQKKVALPALPAPDCLATTDEMDETVFFNHELLIFHEVIQLVIRMVATTRCPV